MITTEPHRHRVQRILHTTRSFSRSAVPKRAIDSLVSAACISCFLFASDPCHSTEQRALSFFHTHTGERLDVVYFRAGQYSEPALDRISHFLRDFRTGDVTAIDRTTLDIVHELKRQLDYRGDIHIVSAYRSERTNEMLRNKGSGVAKKSQHLVGKAIDFRLPGVETKKLRDMAKALRRGGVGYYRKSDFIHVDSGKVRYW